MTKITSAVKFIQRNYLRMIRCVCLIIVFFLAGCFRSVNAQNQLVVRASPFSILDPLTPTILTGMEYRFHRRLAVGLDYGLRTAKIIDGASEKYNDRYFKLKGEFKVFWHLRKNRWYSGVSGFYMPESFDHKNGILITSAGVFNYEQAHMRRDVAGAVIKIGHLVGLSKHWSIDAFGGLGLRLIYSDHSSATGLSVDNTPSGGGVVDTLLPTNIYDYDYPERQNLQVELGIKFNYLILSVKDKR